MDAMDAKTAVSIIIPFYNGIDWLEMIFVAFGKQTFKDFEVIVVDELQTSLRFPLLLTIVVLELHHAEFEQRQERRAGVEVALAVG